MTTLGKLVVVGVLVILGLAAVGGYYITQPGPVGIACTQEAKICPDGTAVGRTGPDCSFAPCPTPAPNLDVALYPLYSGVVWQSAASTSMLVGTSSLSGYEITSAPAATTTDIAGVTTPFVNYYDKKLTGGGWEEDTSLDADGAGSSVRVYKKGAGVIVLSYTSDFQTQSEDVPAQCPCTVSFSIFSTATSTPATP